jgi:uncharacterized protein YjbI with pentapeptide repeats
MKVYKDKEHSVTLRPFSWRGKQYLMVCVGMYVVFDPAGGRSDPRSEQDFWKVAPGAFAAVGRPPVLDEGLPKPGAEVLVAGLCRTPGKKPLPAMEVAFRVGSVRRHLAVFGDRERLPGGGLTDPLPFTAMPLTWDRAFGGPDFPANPEGKGLEKDDAPGVHAPNIENPARFILSGDDRPDPVCPFPVAADNPLRRALSGTYDKVWLDTRWPAFPDDLDPEFFYSAQQAQRLAPKAGASPFFHGDEMIAIKGMNHEFPLIRCRLPEVRIRAFVLTAETFAPFDAAAPETNGDAKARLPYDKDLDGPGLFREAELHLDTVWLLPDLMGAFVLRRALLPVEDDEMDDVLRVFVVTEKTGDAPQTLEFYREELRRRAHPSVDIDLAPFELARDQTAKAIKKVRDLPKSFAKIKKDFLGQSPVMPLNLDHIAHSMGKSIAGARTTLDALEKQMLTHREQFSHLSTFDLSIFSRMRTAVDEQEKNLESMLRQANDAMREAGEKMRVAAANVRGHFARVVPPPGEPADEKRQALLDRLDGLSPESLICGPQPLNPWHDRGFPLLIAARHVLLRNDPLLTRLTGAGFEEKTLNDDWIGYAAETLEDAPERWGLPKNPARPGFTLPPGLYVPRFDGNALTALRVYPLDTPDDPEKSAIRGLGSDAASVALVPGSDESPLSLPAAYPGGAVCVAPEDLSALFAEQEAGDFCHMAAAGEPALLAAVKDLPPLLPKVPADKGGLPLVVIVPPGAEGDDLFAPWRAAYPLAVPLRLPEGCPHVLALAEHGYRLRRLLLDVLPPELAKVHDFDTPLPSKDGPPQPFTLNLPLPTKEEMQGRIETLIKDIRAHFPDPRERLAEETAKARERALAMVRNSSMPPEALKAMEAKLEAAFAAAAQINPADIPSSVAGIMEKAAAGLARAKENLPAEAPPEQRELLLDLLKAAEERLAGLGERLAPLDKLREEGTAKLDALEKGELPEEIKAAFAKSGVNPDALKQPTRAEVEAELAGKKNFSHRNLQELDLSGLDFSGADLSHAVCRKTNFQDCRMNGVDFTFTLANEADFSRATFRDAVFRQTVLQKAVLREADFTAARLELAILGGCDATKARFDAAEIKLCAFNKAVLDDARFTDAMLSLCAFGEVKAERADFRKVRAFKCLFQKTGLAGALFAEAVLDECLFQGAAASGVSFAGADLRKLHTNLETDLSGADFSGADMRNASLRLTRLPGADFYKANLENALFTQCDLSRARLDGLRGAGCRFIKCDLTGADLSRANLFEGSLRKCRLDGADLSEACLYSADLRRLVVDAGADFTGMNCKRTLLEGKEEVLRDVAHGNS